MDFYRLRVEVNDDPGCLGRALVGLGDLRINVVEIDAHSDDGAVRVDDLLIHPTRPTDIPAIADAVGRVGCRVIEIRAVSVHELEDPVTRSLRLMASIIVPGGPDDDLLAWCAGALVRSDLACVIDERVARVDSIAGRALADDLAVHGREPMKRLTSPDGHAWSLAVPFRRNRGRAAVLLSRRASGFTRTETARVRALLDSVASNADAPGHAAASPASALAGPAHGR